MPCAKSVIVSVAAPPTTGPRPNSDAPSKKVIDPPDAAGVSAAVKVNGAPTGTGLAGLAVSTTPGLDSPA